MNTNRLTFDLELPTDSDKWMEGRLIDELFLNLAATKENIYVQGGKIVTVHKYYHQARAKMFWIPITKGEVPFVFVIHLSDLEDKVKHELEFYWNHDKNEFQYILTQAVWRIFENLNFSYFHVSIARYLAVRIER